MVYNLYYECIKKQKLKICIYRQQLTRNVLNKIGFRTFLQQ